MDSGTVSPSRATNHKGLTNCTTDALQVLKQDPAILEAQIRVNSNTKSSSTSEPDGPPNNTTETEKTAEENLRKDVPGKRSFEEMIKMQKAALLSLAPDQLDLLLSYAGMLRMQRLMQQKPGECALCKKNGKPSSWYTTHVLKDSRGRVRCPVLRGYRCPVCGATGDRAHTIKYCPENQYGDRWSR